MKRLPILALCLFAGTTFAQEPVQKEIKTDVKAVTVYLQGAQETRTAAVDVPAGKTLLKFGDLSPFIDAKSVQVKADGALTILSVNHQQNFLDKPDKPDEQVKLEAKLKGVNDQIDLENTALEVIDEDLAFLKENRVMSGKNQALTVLALKEATDFYNNKLTDLKIKSTQHRKTLEELQKQAAEIQGQLNILTNKKEYASGEVLVLVEAKQPVKTTFELVYIVSNAGWNPSYDIRANNINEPIEVVYKANIRQDTKEDWKNVHLKLSSYNPSETGVAPELKTYYLDYNTTPPVYGKSITSVSGRVSDTEGKGVAGVNVTVDGSGISTVTNAQGSYSLTLPANAQQLNFSLIGYIPQTRFISGSVLNVVLQENQAILNDVVRVTVAEAKGSDEEHGVDIADLEEHQVLVAEPKAMLKIRGTASLGVPKQQVEKQISVDFDIKTPYTVKSDNNVVSVDMDVLSLPATFQYYCAPKLNKEVYLTALLQDWEKYNFLEGEANVFFEDTYVGKTILDVNAATDTLSLSLGRDKKVSVQRDKVKGFTAKQFIGSKKEETRIWKTTVRNNRKEAINLLLLDQVPVSQNEEIEVTVQASDGGKQTPETGEIKWETKLDPGKTQSFDLKYVVKYPKNKFLIIE